MGTKQSTATNRSLKDFSLTEFSGLQDENVIKLFGENFQKELEYLKDAYSTPETGEAPPTGGENSPSKLLYGEDYVEVNRTTVGMLALKWVLANDYHGFTRCQPPSLILTPTSFANLRSLCISHFEHSSDIFTLLVVIVINDLGKSTRFAKEVERVTGQSMSGSEHDAIVNIAAKANIIPCLRQLDDAQREEVLLGLQIGSELNIAQFAQAENVPGSLKGAKLMIGHRRTFDLKFLEILFDVAGAGGHIDARCAKQMTEPVYQSYIAVHESLLNIIEERGSLRQNYDQLLIKHAQNLQQRQFRRLSVEVTSERALLRLMVMGRSTSSKGQAELFAAAFEGLSVSDQQALVNGLSVDGVDDGEAIIPYYMPALFAAALKNTLDSSASKIAALASLMRLLGRVYGGSRPDPGKPGSIVERNLRYVKDEIDTVAFKRDPRVLDQFQLTNEE